MDELDVELDGREAAESYIRREFPVEWSDALCRMLRYAEGYWPGHGTDFEVGARDLRRLIDEAVAR